MYVNMKIAQSELEKLRQKYIKINIDQHNLWKFTSLKFRFITSIETNMYQQPT